VGGEIIAMARERPTVRKVSDGWRRRSNPLSIDTINLAEVIAARTSAQGEAVAVATDPKIKTADIEQLCINSIRVLAIDAVQKANSGHPGMPMGMAPIGYLLFTRFMRHNPRNPHWHFCSREDSRDLDASL